MQVAIDEDLPILMTVAPNGTFIPEVKQWAGRFVKDADPYIIEDLDKRGLLFKSKEYTHTYPFCWRCDTPLLYYARPTWYIRTSELKDKLVSLNKEINWYPNHIRDGRFGNWLENNIDWALGRERYWGTPLPVWECEKCHYQECIGSVAELSEKTGKDLKGLDLHRPHVDEIEYVCPKCGETMKRSCRMLIDVWFDSGSMPVAQWHYPYENQEEFKKHFPADYICEAVDQNARLVLFTTRHFNAPLWGEVFQECCLPGADPGWRRAQDVQDAREYRGSLERARFAGRGRDALVPVHSQPAWTRTPFFRRSGFRSAA